jgi:hypothetical protein
MNTVVVGAGTWGTAFARVLLARGHEVTLAARDAEQARAIAETGRNPRYLPDVDLTGADATTIRAAPFDEADLVAVAVPSVAFADVVEQLGGTAPVLSLTKGLDPRSGERLSTLVRGRPVAFLSGPNFAEEVADGLPMRSKACCSCGIGRRVSMTGLILPCAYQAAGSASDLALFCGSRLANSPQNTPTTDAPLSKARLRGSEGIAPCAKPITR